MVFLDATLRQNLAWAKGDGLLPAVIQDVHTRQVLMLGYMNEASLAATEASGRVTFFSRSRQQLWQKGETSGNVLHVERIEADCDGDTLLVLVRPVGPTCHRETVSCFGAGDADPLPPDTAGATPAQQNELFLGKLWRIIEERAAAQDATPSYTRKLLASGIRRQAQKVGEEGVEVALAAVAQDDAALLGEVADLFYHTLVVLKGRGLSLQAVMDVLASRHS